MVKRTASVVDEGGNILILTAFLLPVLLGVTALSIDASFMYAKRNRLYAAADAAAKATADEVRGGNATVSPNLQNFANHEVSVLFPTGTPSATVHCPPLSGPFASGGTCAASGYVEVIVSQPTPTFFAKFLGWNSLTPGARAVAGASAGPACMIGLGTPGVIATNINFSNDNFVMLSNCTISTRGNMTNQPGARLSVGGISVSGNTCSGCPAGTFTLNAPPPADPLAGLPTPGNPGGCAALGAANNSPAPGCYSSFNVGGSRTVTLSGGGGSPYYLTGGLNVSGTATINGTGTIYIAGGAVTIGSGVTFGLAAPTSGTYHAIVMFQAHGNASGATFNNMGNNGQNLTGTIAGALYFPDASVTFVWSNFSGGSAPGSNCIVVVAKQIIMTDNATGNFDNACSAYGGSPLRTISMAE